MMRAPFPGFATAPYAALSLVLGACVAFKGMFAEAGAEQLDWLLGPAAFLVSRLSCLPFHKLDGAGYYSAWEGVLIAPACSGLNFFIILLAAGGCLIVLMRGRFRDRFLYLAAMVPAAYAFGLAVNTCRILAAMALYKHNVHIGPLGPAEVHRLEGILVYYTSLCLFVPTLAALLRKNGRENTGFGQGNAAWAAILAFLPLGCYLLFAVGVPLANGAAGKSASFTGHALTVFAVSAGISYGAYRAYRKRAGAVALRSRPRYKGETQTIHADNEDAPCR